MMSFKLAEKGVKPLRGEEEWKVDQLVGGPRWVERVWRWGNGRKNWKDQRLF